MPALVGRGCLRVFLRLRRGFAPDWLRLERKQVQADQAQQGSPGRILGKRRFALCNQALSKLMGTITMMNVAGARLLDPAGQLQPRIPFYPRRATPGPAWSPRIGLQRERAMLDWYRAALLNALVRASASVSGRGPAGGRPRRRQVSVQYRSEADAPAACRPVAGRGAGAYDDLRIPAVGHRVCCRPPRQDAHRGRSACRCRELR